MVEISNREDLESWLKDRPREDVILIAARAALRLTPLLVRALYEGAENRRASLVLPVFRALSVSWIAASDPTQSTAITKAGRTAITKAGRTAARTSAPFAASGTGTEAAASAAVFAARAAFLDADPGARAAIAVGAADADDSARAAGLAAGTNATAFAAVLAAAAWNAVSTDATALENGNDSEHVATTPLWPDEMPIRMKITWAELQDHLLTANEGWEVWTDWYDDRLHGRPFNKTLEEARVLIPEAIWEQGPKAVNGEIKRLIDKHTITATADITLPGLTGAGVGTVAPELPAEPLTPIRFEFRDGALRRAPPEAPHPPEERRAAAESGWRANRALLDDFIASGGGRQNPRLATVLRRCREAMGKDFQALDVILLGVHHARLQGFAERADEVLMSEDAAELVALNAQLGLFLGQFPEWADYLGGISGGFGTAEAEQQAVEDAKAALAEIEHDAPGLIAPDAKEGLDALADAATPEPTPEDPAPLAQPVERRSFLRAARAAFRTLAEAALSGITKGVAKSAESTTVAAIAGGKGYLLALAIGLPGEFGWLPAIVSYIARMVGPSGEAKGGVDESASDHGDAADD